MAAAAPARPKPVKYSVHTDATSLFKFLTSTFSQMPKSVQIIGWFVFLLLFVYLVLYPMLGITYYEGKIMLWSLDPKTGKPISPAPVATALLPTPTANSPSLAVGLMFPSTP
jgi:hypothetical protein